MRISFTQHTTLLESDLETPVGLFIRLVGELQGILLESAAVDGRWGLYSVIASDFLLSASCGNGLLALHTTDERLAPLQEFAGKPFIQGLRDVMGALHIESDPKPPQAPITRALYGYLGYGIAGMLEPKLAKTLPPEDAEASLVLPGTLIVFDHSYNRITRLTLHLDGKPLTPLSLPRATAGYTSATAAGSSHIPALAGKEGYTAAVTRVKELLRQGEGIQVVLSTPFSAPLTESPFNLYRRLRRINPSPYMFYMRLPFMAGASGGALLGS